MRSNTNTPDQIKPGDNIVLYDAKLNGNFVWRRPDDFKSIAGTVITIEDSVVHLSCQTTHWANGAPWWTEWIPVDITLTEIQKYIDEGLVELVIREKSIRTWT